MNGCSRLSLIGGLGLSRMTHLCTNQPRQHFTLLVKLKRRMTIVSPQTAGYDRDREGHSQVMTVTESIIRQCCNGGHFTAGKYIIVDRLINST